MKYSNKVIDLFDGTESTIDITPNEEAVNTPAVSNPTQGFEYLAQMQQILKNMTILNANQSFIQAQQEQLTKELSEFKVVEARLSAKDTEMLLALPQSIKTCVENYVGRCLTEKLDAFKQSAEQIVDDTKREMKNAGGRGFWISTRNFYIALVILEIGVSFGAWGVAQLGSRELFVTYFATALGLPVFLFLKWLFTEKLFRKAKHRW